LFLKIDCERIVRTYVNRLNPGKLEQIFKTNHNKNESEIFKRINNILVHLDDHKLNRMYHVIQIILKLNTDETSEKKEDNFLQKKSSLKEGKFKF
jgi:hypothetical protein